jgi:hypothetical protein
VDGDGFDDSIVGLPFYDRPSFPNPVVDAGNATVLSGATGASTSGSAAGDRSGFDVNGAGDVNADGFADVLIGIPGRDSGSFAVYLGLSGAWPGRVHAWPRRRRLARLD